MSARERLPHVEQRHGDRRGERAAAPRSAGTLSVLDEQDFGWISAAIDHVEAAAGQPWRVALEAIDGLPVPRRKLAAVRSGIARALGGAGKLTAMARRVRERVLGKPALDGDERAARLARSAAALGVAEEEVDGLLFMDLPGERPIVLNHGRPSELEVAAYANVALIQRALRSAHRVTLRLWGDDGTLVRAALSRGLLVTASRDPVRGATVLAIVGPLALVQRTAVYGRAIGQLVPLLSGATRFSLELETKHWRGRLEAPVLLPSAPSDRRGTYAPTKLARALERFDAQLQVAVGPPPIVTASLILCPDLEVVHRGERWYLELVGFWTPAYIANRLAAYVAASVPRVILCVDETRGCVEGEPSGSAANLLRYSGRIDPAAVCAMLVPVSIPAPAVVT